MRKIIIAVCTALFLALASLSVTSPAQGADEALAGSFTEDAESALPDVPEDASPARGCYTKKFARGGPFVITPHSAPDNVLFKAKVWSSVVYDHCEYNDQIKYVAYRIKVIDYVVSPDGGGACGWFHHVNMNVAPMTGWNPEYRTIDCQPGWQPGDVITRKVYPTVSEGQIGHAATDRCATTGIKVFVLAPIGSSLLSSWTTSAGCLE